GWRARKVRLRPRGGSEGAGPAYTVQAHHSRALAGDLRQRLEVGPGRPRYLLTESGGGYCLGSDENATESAGPAAPRAAQADSGSTRYGGTPDSSRPAPARRRRIADRRTARRRVS